MTEMDSAQTKSALDAVLARAGLGVTPADYERLLMLYPALRTQAADLRIPELSNLEPAVIYPARSTG
jgi:hypothetical protein